MISPLKDSLTEEFLTFSVALESKYSLNMFAQQRAAEIKLEPQE